MILDIVFAIMIILAILKGYSHGFIVAVFSVIALVVALAAAIKLSTVAAAYLQNSVNVSSKWLPVISFALVFLIAVLIVRLAAKAIEKALQIVMLGWLNRLAGILLYTIIYTIVLSVVLFYAEKIKVINEETIAASKVHDFIQPLGPRAIEALSFIIPFFKNMFQELEAFFDSAASKTK